MGGKMMGESEVIVRRIKHSVDVRNCNEVKGLTYYPTDDEYSGLTIIDLETGITPHDLICEGRQHLTKELLELEEYLGVNLLNVRYGFMRNKRLQQLCRLILDEE